MQVLRIFFYVLLPCFTVYLDVNLVIGFYTGGENLYALATLCMMLIPGFLGKESMTFIRKTVIYDIFRIFKQHNVQDQWGFCGPRWKRLDDIRVLDWVLSNIPGIHNNMACVSLKQGNEAFQ